MNTYQAQNSNLSLTSPKKQSILCGVTHQDELYFIDIKEAWIEGFGVKVYKHQEAKQENYRRLVEGEFWKSAVVCGRTEKEHDAWIDEVIKEIGDFGLLNLVPELETDIDGEKYLFELSWSGKDKTRLKYYFLNKEFYTRIMTAYNKESKKEDVDSILSLWNQSFNQYYNHQKFVKKSLDLIEYGSEETYLDTFVY